MRSILLSSALAAVLAASMAGKLASLSRPEAALPVAGNTTVAFLQARGFVIDAIDSTAGPAWVAVSRGACRVRVADVSPQGWSRDIVAAQAKGGRLLYAFDGSFYADQPVLRTRLRDYWRRLRYYLGLPAAPLVLRAIIVAPECPEGTIRPQDALTLSRQ
jgi:hypothetical protein